MKFGMIDQENATSLQTIEKGKNELMRLDKFLTEMGLGTRSEVKKILKTKQITVNGEVVTKPETKVAPENDQISYKGEPVTYCEYEYYLFYKPAGCVTATEDQLHKTVMDYLTDTVRSDLFPVGRLDIGEEKLTKPGKLRILKSEPESEIELTITEGRFHQVKRMFEAVGKKVLYLKRISMGPLQLTDDLKPGEYRPLTEEEITALKIVNK